MLSDSVVKNSCIDAKGVPEGGRVRKSLKIINRWLHLIVTCICASSSLNLELKSKWTHIHVRWVWWLVINHKDQACWWVVDLLERACWGSISTSKDIVMYVSMLLMWHMHCHLGTRPRVRAHTPRMLIESYPLRAIVWTLPWLGHMNIPHIVHINTDSIWHKFCDWKTLLRNRRSSLEHDSISAFSFHDPFRENNSQTMFIHQTIRHTSNQNNYFSQDVCWNHEQLKHVFSISKEGLFYCSYVATRKAPQGSSWRRV